MLVLPAKSSRALSAAVVRFATEQTAVAEVAHVSCESYLACPLHVGSKTSIWKRVWALDPRTRLCPLARLAHPLLVARTLDRRRA